jgi:hypothetical protein
VNEVAAKVSAKYAIIEASVEVKHKSGQRSDFLTSVFNSTETYVEEKKTYSIDGNKGGGCVCRGIVVMQLSNNEEIEMYKDSLIVTKKPPKHIKFECSMK